MARSYTSFVEHGKPPAGRRRESRYPAQITARIAGDVKARLEALADQELVAVGIIVRRAIEAGLPVIEGSAADIARRSAMEDARDWWGGLEQPRAWRVARGRMEQVAAKFESFMAIWFLEARVASAIRLETALEHLY